MSCLTSCARRAEFRHPVQRSGLAIRSCDRVERSGSAIEQQQRLTRRRGGTENLVAGLQRTRPRKKRRTLWELRERTCSLHSFFCSLNNADSDDVALCNAGTVSYCCRFSAARRLRVRGVQLPSRWLAALPFLGGTVAPCERCLVAVSSAPQCSPSETRHGFAGLHTRETSTKKEPPGLAGGLYRRGEALAEIGLRHAPQNPWTAG